MSYKIKTDIDPGIFRGYDIRGIIDEQLDEDVYYTFGRAFATHLSERKIGACAVGHDVRINGEKYAAAVIAGLNNGGINTYDLGVSLTQITYFSVYEFRNKAALMISASHNPANYNGLKLSIGYSETMDSEDLIAFRDLCASGQFVEPKQKGVNTPYDIWPAYKADTLKRFSLKKPWKIVIDGISSGAGKMTAEIFRDAGCTVIEQNCEPDGHFPTGTPDPIDAGVLQRLGDGVKAAGADIGFSFDADGDRMAVADENGQPLWMDIIVALFSKAAVKAQPGAKVVYNTLCSRAVTETIEQAGGQPIMWLTGHAFIKQKMALEKAAFGGELSGHIFFADNFYSYDDGANACLRLLDFLESEEKTLSQAVAELPQYISSPQIKIGMDEKIKFSFIADKLTADFKAAWPEAEFTDIDGIRFDLPDRMAIVRASQNGAYITAKFEGKTQDIYDEVRVKLANILHKYPEVNWDSPESSNVDALG
ncbi:phosphoglucomutase [Alphaproteobacteria bacterium]|nr:phosphoglucomutase [Alphaproteobacteria bacterium]